MHENALNNIHLFLSLSCWRCQCFVLSILHASSSYFSYSVSCQKVWVGVSWNQESFLFIFAPPPYIQRKPLVLEGMDLGTCTSKWTVDYLTRVGGRREVKIHVAAVAQMDFISKNFVYRYFLRRFTLGIHITCFKPLKYFCIIMQRPYHLLASLISWNSLLIFKEWLLKDKNSEFTYLYKDISKHHFLHGVYTWYLLEPLKKQNCGN